MESSSITTLLLALVHILLELPHVGFENRSYTALLIHVAYHVTSTFIQLFLRLLCDCKKICDKTFRIVNIVKSGQAYTNEVEFEFENSYETDQNMCSIQAMANSNDGVFEVFSKENNKMSTCCYSIKKKPIADFKINLVNHSQLNNIINLNTSDMFTLSYYFSNTGDGSVKGKQTWTDGLFLYNKSTVDYKTLIKSGLLIGSKTMLNTFVVVECKSNSSIIGFNSFIPSNLEGAWYEFVLHEIETLKN